MNFTYKKPYRYNGKIGTLGKIISSEGVEEVICEQRKQRIEKKVEEDEKEKNG